MPPVLAVLVYDLSRHLLLQLARWRVFSLDFPPPTHPLSPPSQTSQNIPNRLHCTKSAAAAACNIGTVCVNKQLTGWLLANKQKTAPAAKMHIKVKNFHFFFLLVVDY